MWGAAGDRAATAARAAEGRSDAEAAAALFLRAHGYYFFGRFPCPNHPRKLECARLEREAYLDAARFFRIPITRVEVLRRPGGRRQAGGLSVSSARR